VGIIITKSIQKNTKCVDNVFFCLYNAGDGYYPVIYRLLFDKVSKAGHTQVG